VTDWEHSLLVSKASDFLFNAPFMRPAMIALRQRYSMPAAAFALPHPTRSPLVDAIGSRIEFVRAELTLGAEAFWGLACHDSWYL
jgi:hypothetical protein